jgi:hypothetical protein
MPVIAPSRPVRPAASSVADRVAALYPLDLPAAQRLLAQEAVRTLRDAGTTTASLGSYDLHATCDVPVREGRLVLVPMAALWDLDPALAAEDDGDPAVWHLMARDPGGRWVDDPLPGWGCPSVLWAVRAGIDPACGVGLVQAALADPRVAALLGGSR